MEDHKPLWRITVHLSSLISLIPADGKLILLCDRLNPINFVCPIFTSPPAHMPCSPGNTTEEPLYKRRGGILGFKSRRKIRRVGTLMASHFSRLVNYILSLRGRCVLNILSILSCPPFISPAFPPSFRKQICLILSYSPSLSLLHLHHLFLKLSQSLKDKICSSNSTLNREPLMSLNASRGALLSNLTQLLFERRQLLQLSRRKEEEEEAYFADYIPPARDAITLPRNVIYVLVGVVLVIVATYAIVGHLIKDLMHDLADWILGPKPVEDESEEGRAKIEREQRLSVSMMETDRPEMEMVKETEKDGQLPSFYHGDSIHPPSIPPPLRSTITLSIPKEERTSTYNVSYCPMTPYVTSL